jgi:cytidylate kinase
VAVITISREIGAHGTYIAHEVAKRLGYALVDKDAIEEIVREYGFTNFNETYDETSGVLTTLDEMRIQTAEFLKRVLHAVARRGDVVILGRGSFGVFPNYTNVLNVRIHAPIEYRVARIMKREGLTDLEKTRTFVRTNDENRVTFVRTYFGLDFNNVTAFDLVLNTSVIPEDTAVEWILQAAGRLRGLSNASRSTRQEAVDPVLDQTIASVVFGIGSE